MIKKIIACSDVHIRNYMRQEETQEQLSKFIEDCKNIVSEYGEDEVRIVIAGDLLHSKLDISGEGYILAAWFLGQLDNICRTYVIAGNHDINMDDLTRLDPLSAIFSMCKFKQTFYLDKETEYQSGCIVDDNIVWCLYSSFDGFVRPNIDETKLEHPDSTYVGLFHGDVKGAKDDVGYSSEKGFDASYFDGIDFCIMGHIHKRQALTYNGVPLVYCGSMIQQTAGENLSEHGYVIWDAESTHYEPINIPNPDRGFYTFTINNIDDIDNDMENIINL